MKSSAIEISTQLTGPLGSFELRGASVGLPRDVKAAHGERVEVDSCFVLPDGLQVVCEMKQQLRPAPLRVLLVSRVQVVAHLASLSELSDERTKNDFLCVSRKLVQHADGVAQRDVARIIASKHLKHLFVFLRSQIAYQLLVTSISLCRLIDSSAASAVGGLMEGYGRRKIEATTNITTL